MDGSKTPQRLARRVFLARAARYSVAGLSLPVLLEACTSSSAPKPGKTGTSSGAAFRWDPIQYKEATKAVQDQSILLNGDVLDFRLTSDDWEGVFGFVKFRLTLGHVDSKDVYFIRTDASDEDFARQEKLVFVPKLAVLAGDGLAGSVFFVSKGAPGQGAVFSTEPGRDDYTPAWRVNSITWKGAPKQLTSVADVKAAESKGDVSVEQTDVILNAAMVKWSSGELEVDPDLKMYHGGQIIEAPDTSTMTVTFKLNECFPGTRYIVTDHSIQPAAEATKTIFAPGLQEGPSKAGATGRTNVFMNGLPGPGPMEFQPSAFDYPVGDAAWSPYWDHYTYAWNSGTTPRLLRSQSEILAARDAGDLTEFPGVPETKGVVFTVNCPAPVAAPNVYPA